MAEHNTGDEKRYYFHRRQFGLMAVGFIAAAAVIYFLGMLTGAKMGEEFFVESESPPTKVSAQPFVEEPAPLPKALAESKLPTQDVILNPSSEQPSTKEPLQDERLAEKISKSEVKISPSPAREAPVAPSRKTTPSFSPTTTPQGVAEKKAAISQGDKPKESGHTWSVQVKAFSDAASADVLVQGLKAKGYDAYRITVSVKGKIWHRVRAGRFVERNDAEALRKTLAAKEGLKDAFLVRSQNT